MSYPFEVDAVSEDSLMVTWSLGDNVLPSTSLARSISALGEHLVSKYGDRILNVVPAYQTLLVQYQVTSVGYEQLCEAISAGLNDGEAQPPAIGKCHRIPVWYHAEVAPDLEALCAAKDLHVEALIQRHTDVEYTVFAVGFQPGFAYLGYVDEALQTPRHSSFRPLVAAGSVAIADRQTAIYPSASPGGWQIIGRTPQPPTQGQFRAGDTVRFVAIDKSKYQRLALTQSHDESIGGGQ